LKLDTVIETETNRLRTVPETEARDSWQEHHQQQGQRKTQRP
jgi:hypothetical protein